MQTRRQGCKRQVNNDALLSIEPADKRIVLKLNMRRIAIVATVAKITLIASLSFVLAGCETTPEFSGRAPAHYTPSAHIVTPEPPAPLTNVTVVPDDLVIAPPTPLPEPPPAPTTLAATSTPPVIALTAPATNTPSATGLTRPSWPTNWVNAWIPLESWGKYNSLGKPARLASGLSSIYEFRTTNGVLAFKIGSRLALCNGLEFWLGYAPLVLKGLPCVHWLDAQKILQPLITPAPSPYKSERTIVLDPGHGGKDIGTKSAGFNAFEKQYTLDLALRLRSMLLTNGWKVLLTRTNDLDVSLPDRVAVADRAKADLFLSLHFNSGFPNRTLAGVETYCLTPVGLPSSLVRDYEDNLKQTFPNNAFDEQNFQIAQRLHRSVVQTVCAVDRGVRRARFMGVLRAQNRPAILIEAGYLSNPAEADKIASAEYRQKLAEAVARALE